MAGIVADIATASSEQADGIDQINIALTQMDEATQQNSALVEQNAATAKMLEQQAKSMDECVAFFKLDAAKRDGEPPRAADTRELRAAAAVPLRKAAALRGGALSSSAA